MLRCHDTFAGFGKRPIRGNIEVAGIRVPADIDWKATIHKTTTFRLRQNEAQKLNRFRQTLTRGDVDKINLELNFEYIPNSAYLAVLRIAYLAMFREVGYKYVLSPAAGVIRKLIASYPDRTRILVGSLQRLRMYRLHQPSPSSFFPSPMILPSLC